MEHKTQVKYHFIAQVFILFAFDVLFLMIFATLFGEEAKEVSSLYSLGSTGISIFTLSQFLLNSVVIIFIKTIFYSEHIFKKMSAFLRTALMLFCIFTSTIFFIIVFEWFPLDHAQGWIGFLLCFMLGFFGSITYLLIRTNYENKRYDKLLSDYKNNHGGNDNVA